MPWSSDCRGGENATDLAAWGQASLGEADVACQLGDGILANAAPP